MTEGDVVKALNKNLRTEGFAFRLKQSQFVTQYIDILCNGKVGYFAIEHKSMRCKGKPKPLNFGSAFSTDKHGVHQIVRISKFVKRSNLIGLLVVELRMGQGRKKEWYMFPWSKVKQIYNSGAKSISSKMFKKCYRFKLNRIGKILKKYSLKD